MGLIRIIHVTDFHLNDKNLRDWKDYVRDAMISKLNELHSENAVGCFACTGDLIDMGGKGKAPERFQEFKIEVIEPICGSVGIGQDRFLIVPGNHDIDRNADSKRDELGSRELFKDQVELADFMVNAIENDDFDGFLRTKDYKEFEQQLYEGSSTSIDRTVFGSSFIFEEAGLRLGVCGLNNSWRCYERNDKSRLLIGEQQLVRATKFVNDCDLKIALVHHPLDWLADVERKTITHHINLEFDLLLLGHSHETMTSVRTGFNGSLFVNLAPSGLNDIRNDSRTFANGFTVIDYDKDENVISCTYWRYNHAKKRFVLNTDEGEGDGGRAEYPISPKPDAGSRKKLYTIVDEIKEDHFKSMDQHLLGARADISDLSIKDGFVFPPIIDALADKDSDSGGELVTLNQIISGGSNLIFFGGPESGKTALLYRLTRELVDEYEFVKKIPVYIDFAEIGNKEVRTAIKDYLKVGTTTANKLVENNQVTLLVDNLNFDSDGDLNGINRINRFHQQNPQVRIIASADCEIVGIAPEGFDDLCEISFKSYFIKNLRAKEIKSLMKLWVPEKEDDGIETGERLERMVSTFESYALPSTPMSVSLFLWSTEYSEKEPINGAVLLEIYIEIILEKLNVDNIYRKTFDFTNKLQLLASIAHAMLAKEKQNYSLKYSEYLTCVENYLEQVGFQHDPKVLSEYFIERKIFQKFNGGRIRFSTACFFHFFLAKRMQFNQEFREHVIDPEEFYKYPKELDYYTGLVRSDKHVLELVLEQFEKVFEPAATAMENLDIDVHFTPNDPDPSPIAKTVEIETITENRPSDEMMESFQNRRLENVPNPREIMSRDDALNVGRILVIMSNVLRNSEGVEDYDLKASAYNRLVKNSLVYMVLHREAIIDYVVKHERLPHWVPEEIDLINYLKNIPFYVQTAMFKHTGTPKLNTIVLKKINEDIRNASRVSNIETFLSVANYSDVQGKDFDKSLKKFIKVLKTNRNNYITSDYLFYKLLDYYYRRTRPDSTNEEMYLDLLAELRIKTQNLPNAMKERVIKTFVDAKKKFLKLTEGAQ